MNEHIEENGVRTLFTVCSMTIGTRFADGGASHWSTIDLRDWPAKGWKHLLEDKVDRREMDVKAVRSDIESSGCEFKLFGCWNEQSHVTYASFGHDKKLFTSTPVPYSHHCLQRWPAAIPSLSGQRRLLWTFNGLIGHL